MANLRGFRMSLAAFAAGISALLTGAAAEAKPNWALVYSQPNSGNALISLSAVDASNAWAVGISSSNGNSQAVGLRTIDGVNWFPLNLPPVNTGPMGMALYMLVAFQSPQVGWMHGISVSMAGQQGMVWKTSDGGTQWQQVFQSPNMMDQLQALPDGSVFGAGVNVVLVSKDGTVFVEKPVPIPGDMDLNGIAMLNSDCGFAVAATASDSGTMGTAVLWTGDGGDTWQSRFENREFRLNRASFVSPNLGWAAGSRNGTALVAKTTDGGNTWAPVAIPAHDPVMNQPDTVPATDCVDVKFFDDLRGVAACLACTGECDGAEGSNPSYLTVFVRTVDGGQSWAVDPDYEPLMSAPPFGAMMKFSGMLAMSFPDPNAGFLAGQNNLILRYSAAAPEAPGWGPSGCDPGAGGGGPGSGGGSGTGPGSSGAAPGSDSGCGCYAAGTHAPAAPGLLALVAGAALVLRRRRSS